MRRAANLCAVAAVFALAGCTVGPKYQTPAVPVAPADQGQLPAEFTESQGWKQARPAETELGQSWWQIFGSQELNDLEAQVDVSNQNIQAAESQFRQARALVAVNRSNLYPSVTAGYALSTTLPAHNAATTSASLGEYGNTVLPIDVSYELDAWGRIRRTIAAAQAEMQAGAADVASARLSLHAELAIDYFELHSLDAQKELLDRTLVSYEKALELNQNRYEGGLVSGAEVAQARTQLETTRAQSIDVKDARAQYEHAIAVLAGRTPESLQLPVSPLVAAPPVIPTGIPSQLLEQRPDIAAAERRMAEANERIGIARAAYFPTLMLTAAAGIQSSSFANWLSWPSRFWALGPNMLETLFDAGRRRALAESATAGYDTTVANYRATALSAFKDVEDNLSTLRILERESAAQRLAVQAAERSLELSMNRYTGGLVTYLEVVTAQNIALQNQRVEVDLLRRRMDACVRLIKALGGGWDVSKLPS